MKEPRQSINPIVLTCVIVLCAVACTLTLMLPGESLVIDLIYRGF
jgi:hypothetical protein